MKVYQANGQASSQVILNNVGATVDTSVAGSIAVTLEVDVEWTHNYPEFGSPNGNRIKFAIDGTAYYAPDVFDTIVVNPILDADGVPIEGKYTIVCAQGGGVGQAQAEYLQGGYFYAPGQVGWTLANGQAQVFTLPATTLVNTSIEVNGRPQLEKFDLDNIDKMRMRILEAVASTNPFVIRDTSLKPYNLPLGNASGNYYYAQANQEGLAIKTYQSDLFNSSKYLLYLVFFICSK